MSSLTDKGRVLYRSWMSDNLRWDALQLRDGDIVISAPPKCGTTWTQRLVSLLVFDGPQLPGPLHLVSPWLDLTAQPVEHVVAALSAQRHRRFIKTHTPLDGLPLDDRVTYIGVGRDPRDAAMSMLAEHDRMRALREATGPEGEPWPPIRRDFGGEFGPLEVLRIWMEGPVTPTEGIASLATILHHFDSFWSRRELPNVALFHYADYQADLAGELMRLAVVLGVELGPDRAAELAEHATLAAMRSQSAQLAPRATAGLHPKDVRREDDPFFRTGGRGRWPEIFTEAEHRRYPERAAEIAEQLGGPELVAWAHQGRRGAPW
ncbi:sulfotransferase [Mycobacterium szulgai]|uniref:Sulfotransferase n=2 Tax=Mycobacterium szulgai TaxID=1787 RepID=A0A1X2EF52_MYCSZ|nr:sulfotransferase domain-containing protein [Mycobacterium szulgai]ORX00023.1 sulfotransferase [Mycobacterium szulgai]